MTEREKISDPNSFHKSPQFEAKNEFIPPLSNQIIDRYTALLNRALSGRDGLYLLDDHIYGSNRERVYVNGIQVSQRLFIPEVPSQSKIALYGVNHRFEKPRRTSLTLFRNGPEDLVQASMGDGDFVSFISGEDEPLLWPYQLAIVQDVCNSLYPLPSHSTN